MSSVIEVKKVRIMSAKKKMSIIQKAIFQLELGPYANVILQGITTQANKRSKITTISQ